MNKLKSQKGFTLIELLVVIAIIGILSSVILSSLNTARLKSRDAKRKSDLHQMQNALALYYSDNGAYPAGTSFSSWASDWSVCGWSACGNTINLYNGLVGGKYISSLPADPVNKEGGAGNYLGDNAPIDQAYYYSSDGKTYAIGTNLENGGGTASNAGNYQVSL